MTHQGPTCPTGLATASRLERTNHGRFAGWSPRVSSFGGLPYSLWSNQGTSQKLRKQKGSTSRGGSEPDSSAVPGTGMNRFSGSYGPRSLETSLGPFTFTPTDRVRRAARLHLRKAAATATWHWRPAPKGLHIPRIPGFSNGPF